MKNNHIRNVFLFIGIVTIGIVMPACGEKSPENVLVQVDDTVITLDDFKREWVRQPLPPPGAPQESVDQFIEDMIAEKLFIIEARRRKIDQDERFKREVEKYREQLMVETLLNQEVLAVDKPGESDIEAYWLKNKGDFSVPPLTRFSHIVIKIKEGESSEDALLRCTEILERLSAGEDFAEVAREVSEGSNAGRGGDLGYFRPSQIPPEFQEAAKDLETGEVSEPIKTASGCRLVSVTDRKPAREKTLDESREEVVGILLAGKRKAKFDVVKSRLAASVDIWKNTDLINRLRTEQQKAMAETR